MLTLETARPWYPASDPVHGFDHVRRVYRIAEHLALAEGADLEIVRAAALLHDVCDPRGSIAEDVLLGEAGQEQGRIGQQGKRWEHQQAAAEFAAQVLRGEGWTNERISAVQHCILAHRFRGNSAQPQSLEAQVLFDADKLDAIGAVGAARAIAYAVRSGLPIYSPPSKYFLRTGREEEGELHSAYHEYLFKLSKIKGRLYTATARDLAEERHQWMAEFFERLAVEWRG